MGRVLLLIIALLLPASVAANSRSLCGDWRIENAPMTMRFNSTERELICGVPKTANWKNIPPDEAFEHLRLMLRMRGYYHPTMRQEGEKWIANVGPRTQIRSFTLTGDVPKSIARIRRRAILKRTLTPAELDSVESWGRGVLASHGYPCGQAQASADITTGHLALHLSPGKRMRITSVTEAKIDQLNPGTLRRYEAFHTRQWFDQVPLSLTAQRIQNSRNAQYAFFETKCTPNGAELKQHVVVGKPRSLSFSLGASTEEYIIAKGAWHHARLDRRGSDIGLEAYASYRLQQLRANGHWYWPGSPTRWHLTPDITISRTDEPQYSYLSADTSIGPGATLDIEGASIRLWAGPGLNYTKTVRSNTQLHALTHFLSLRAHANITSHDFEYYNHDPRGGFSINGSASLSQAGVFATSTAQKFAINGVGLWNIAGFDPPLFLLGIRGGVASTLIANNQTQIRQLPPEYLYFLGGDANLRGFSRGQLPPNNTDALTQAWSSLELRLTQVLPTDWQPLVFIDAGMLGATSFHLDEPIYWSPGFGIRWPSALGILRATLAHGFLANNPNPANNWLSHWQFYLGFGQEF